MGKGESKRKTLMRETPTGRLLHTPQPGTDPKTQAHALNGNHTDHPPVLGSGRFFAVEDNEALQGSGSSPVVARPSSSKQSEVHTQACLSLEVCCLVQRH